MRVGRKEIAKAIKAYSVPAFRICPISCVKFPAIFFVSPYPEDMLRFLDHTVGHEVFHLKLAFSLKGAYFVPSEAAAFYMKGGYDPYILEEYFPSITSRLGLEETQNLVNDLSERLRDFFINKQLMELREFSKITVAWETLQASKDASSVLRTQGELTHKGGDYATAFRLIDLGMRKALLQGRGGVFQKEVESKMPLAFNRMISNFSDMFRTSNAQDPYKMKTFIESVDEDFEFTSPR